MSDREQLRQGYLYALAAYLGWGFVPIYWKFLKHVPSAEILAHRIVWSFVFYSLILFFKNKKWTLFRPAGGRNTIALSIGAFLLMSNWFVYIYAVNSNQIVESSLGYFINPLVNILLGVVLLGEKLSKIQKVAALLAACGVAVIAYEQSGIPWIALFLAVTFSLYGFIKKTIQTDTLHSNQFESALTMPLAIAFLIMQPMTWQTPENSFTSWIMLIGAGVITGVPLLFFSAAAQRIPYYMMGFFQFIAPSLQFITGVYLFNEPMSFIKLKGFILIWCAGLLLILSSKFKKAPK